MEKLKIDLKLFNDISLEDCLNAQPVLTRLDNAIYHKLKPILSKAMDIKDSSKRIEYILTQSLLKLSRDPVLLKIDKEYNLSLLYLYTLIKREVYTYCPEAL